jgi:predicted YcjX-like family ATPase
MTKKDRYVVTLNKILDNLEEIYGLNATVNGDRLANLQIADVVAFYNNQINGFQKQDVSNLNAAAGKELILLSYLSQRMHYFNKKRIDFSHYPNMKIVSKILISFTKASSINEKSMRSINKIISLLVEIDKRHINLHNSLSYRYLRIFIILVMFGNFCNASVVADFLLNQIIVREDLH